MRKKLSNKLAYCLLVLSLCFSIQASYATYYLIPEMAWVQAAADTTSTPYPVKKVNPFTGKPVHSPLQLNKPSNFTYEVEYDENSNQYIIREKVGNMYVVRPSAMSAEDFRKYNAQKSVQQHWRDRKKGESKDRGGFRPSFRIGGEAFDKIFGSNTINIVPQGSAELIFGVDINQNDNPAISEDLRRTTTFDFKTKIIMNVEGSIGDKVKLGINYNTEATFEFENRTKLEYTGKEDEIIKKIEAGNVSLPLTGSLISGSQSLFGLKTEMQFGKLTVTSVFSQQKGETKTIEVKGGASTTQFELKADEYEGNKHFFLSHYFREIYEDAMSSLPTLKTKIEITKIEVWVTNKKGTIQNNRNLVAFMDMGEERDKSLIDKEKYIVLNKDLVFNNYSSPDNGANDLYSTISNIPGIRNISQINTSVPAPYQNGKDYEKLEQARRLNETEFTLNKSLGYISLNLSLNSDEILAVAFEYRDQQGTLRKVGEFSDIGASSETLIMKLLKGTNLSPKYPNWDLMMKNVYAIGAYQVNPDNFIFDVYYQDDQTGTPINYFNVTGNPYVFNKRYLQLMNLDKLNSSKAKLSDGRFDFIEGVTINSSNGRVIFPLLEPFGKHLADTITDGGKLSTMESYAKKYAFTELYDSTKTKAKQQASKNKFILKGQYQSSVSSDIPLNAMNIPHGSVVVTAAGKRLTENVDYTVDYNLGRVKVLNTGLLESGTPILISLESNSLFNVQTKTLLGTHLDYRVNDNFRLGATVLNLTEKPLTKKVNIGDEPISNTIWGIDGSYRSEVPALTRFVDWLPFIETKEPSSVTVEGEFAHLIPGHSKTISKKGLAYIDDFEGTKTTHDIKSYHNWYLASTPQKNYRMTPEGDIYDSLVYGENRAQLSWFTVDPMFNRNTSTTPGHISDDDKSNHLTREVYITEIFEKDVQQNTPSNIQVLNLSFYPNEKGPYNFDTKPTKYSAGIDKDGFLNNPETRWAGIMRSISQSDFEANNIEFIEFWMLDPFVNDDPSDPSEGGDLYFQLGNVSEDILRDGRKSFENGLPKDGDLSQTDSTAWARVSKLQTTTAAFDDAGLANQDVGYDGLRTNEEAAHFTTYISGIDNLVAAGNLTQVAAERLKNDPSNDNYAYYRGSQYDVDQASILRRYKYYNGVDGNSQSTESYSTIATNVPDVEDINKDNTLSETESYYEYKISLRRKDIESGMHPFITDTVVAKVDLVNGKQDEVRWYQFKIPLKQPDQTVGDIDDFKSIRFMRMLLRGYKQESHLRFARLDLVRSEWRKFEQALDEGKETTTAPQINDGALEISAVSLEENSRKSPVNYILPPNIEREIDASQPQVLLQNEQSMQLIVTDLSDGDARAAYKNIGMDFRNYKRIVMDVHAEAKSGNSLNDGDLRLFFRIGSDYKENYYEYEIPLKVTPAGTYGDEGRYDVWPTENKLDVDFIKFQEVKQARNKAMTQLNSDIQLTSLYRKVDGDNRVSIKGNPVLSDVRTLMIGIRNPSKRNNTSPDDGLPKSAEVWVNELRLTDFDEKGGWAANGRVTTKLADLGSFTVAGAMSTPGFGSLDSKISERSKEEKYNYDFSSNFELGKFFNDKYGVSIPFYFGYSEAFINPEYDPENPDLKLKAAINNAETQKEKDAIRKRAQDYTMRKSINFTNVRIGGKQGAKKHFYSPSNFSFTYAYNETFIRNYNIEHQVQENQRMVANYLFNKRPKNVAPFKKSKLLKSKYLSLLRDFNFYYLPSQVSVNFDLNRNYFEEKIRNLDAGAQALPINRSKDFLFNRNYQVKFDLSKSLKLDLTASNKARLGDPDYDLKNEQKGLSEYEIMKNEFFEDLNSWGRTQMYFHDITLRYDVPIKKIPLLNWTSANLSYSAHYEWNAGNNFYDINNEEAFTGNRISNNNRIQLNSQLNMKTLYNKVGYLKRVQQKYNSNRRKKAKKQYKTVKFNKDRINLKANTAKNISHKLGTTDVKVKVYAKDGKEIKGELVVINSNKVSFKAKEDFKAARVQVEGKVEKKPNPVTIGFEYLTLLATSVKNINFTINQQNGTNLIGFNQKSGILGQSYGGITAPGWTFISGWQDDSFAEKTIENGWMTKNPTTTMPYEMNTTTTFQFRARIEPIKNFKIELDARRSHTERSENSYVYKNDENKFDQFSPIEHTGNFSISTISIGTAFEKLSADDSWKSESFEKFRNSRVEVSKRLGTERQNAPNNGGYKLAYDEKGYAAGYGEYSQEVLIPAFLESYTMMNNKMTKDDFPLIPLPNWKVTYNGLAKIKPLKKHFRSINLTHSYKSTYSVGSYQTNQTYLDQILLNEAYSEAQDANENFVPENSLTGGVSINEQFSPLIGVDMTMKNSFSTRFEIKKSRNMSLSLANKQVTTVSSQEYVLGLGYRFDNVDLFFRSADGEKAVTSDLNLRGDLSIRNNHTVIHRLENNIGEATGGSKIISIKVNADYVLSDRFNIRLFFDRVVNDPIVLSTYRNAKTSFGFSLRFTLTQ